MLKADERLFKARYRDSILAAFVEKGILLPAHAVKGVQKVELQSATGDAKLLSEIKLPENKNEAASTKFVKEVSELLGVPDNEKLDLGVKDGPTTNSMVIKGKFQKWKELKAGISDLPNVKVYLPDGFTLVTGTKNISSISHSHVNDSATIDAASNYLQRLNRLNKIYVPKRDEKIDTMKLVAAHKPYYVDIENKLRRAYYA